MKAILMLVGTKERNLLEKASIVLFQKLNENAVNEMEKQPNWNAVGGRFYLLLYRQIPLRCTCDCWNMPIGIWMPIYIREIALLQII